MATDTDLVNSIAAGHQRLTALAKRADNEPENRAQIYVQMAQLRFILQENLFRLKQIRTNKAFYATDGEKYLFIHEHSYHWTEDPEQRTVASQADMEKLLIAYVGSDWRSRGIQIRELPPHSIAW